MAAADGRFAGLPFVAALAGATFIQVGTNLANDYSDWARGADTPDRVGFTRATQAGLIPPARMRRGIAAAFGIASLLGAYLVWVGGWPILVVGLASIAAGLAYTGGPWPFGYHGLGDLFSFLFFGPVAVGGTYWVQALALPVHVLLAGLGVGSLVTAILVVNNLRDRATDSRAGKRTLAVILGRRGSQAEYAGLLLAALLVPPLGVLVAGWPPAVLLALAAGLAAVRPARTVFTHGHPGELNTALEATARTAGLYGLLLAVGFLL